jgi:hypothetical protein
MTMNMISNFHVNVDVHGHNLLNMQLNMSMSTHTNMYVNMYTNITKYLHEHT